MVRKGLLIATAVALSYTLTALAGYLLYVHSEGRSEAALSIVVRFAINPMIVILVGAVVGRFSKSYPIQVAIVGLLPWIVLLDTPHRPTGVSGWAGWLFPILFYLSLAGAAAWLVWQHEHKSSTQAGRLT